MEVDNIFFCLMNKIRWKEPHFLELKQPLPNQKNFNNLQHPQTKIFLHQYPWTEIFWQQSSQLFFSILTI